MARVEIEVEIADDGKMNCNTQVTNPMDPDDLPPLVTVMGAMELSKDTILRMYMEEDDD